MNEALHRALASSGLSDVDVAAELAVDPKTVDRWLRGRVPHARSREALAKLVGTDEATLWPPTTPAGRQGRLGAEIQAVYPHRWAVPRTDWTRIFRAAESRIDVLVYSGMFLVEDGGILSLLGLKARAGVPIRILVGDPESAEVAQRGSDEQIGEAMASRVVNALTLLRPLVGMENVVLRVHRTTLYNSIYRADDEMLVNTHIYGLIASSAPVVHLRRAGASPMFSNYAESFEQVWSSARSYAV